MLPPEEHYGNIEYKRNILNKNINRLEELATQMNFRINEGDGKALYYIGVEDDGSIFEQPLKNLDRSLTNLNKICKIIKSQIVAVNKQENYYKIEISKKSNNGKNIIILLIGDSRTGKTSFISNLIKRKTGLNNNLFMLKHKHEIQSGKTSSFTYHRFKFNNINYIFIDTPGDNKYIKTTHKIVSQSKFNIVLLFYKKHVCWKYENYFQQLFHKRNTPIIRINYNSEFNKFPKYNNNDKINRKVFFKNINQMFRIILSDDGNPEFKSMLNIISCTITNIGTIISGFVFKGFFNRNDIVYYNLKSKKIEFSIKSIHFNEKEIDKINTNNFCSILISNEIKIKNGFIYK